MIDHIVDFIVSNWTLVRNVSGAAAISFIITICVIEKLDGKQSDENQFDDLKWP
jgi:hypothetical protein